MGKNFIENVIKSFLLLYANMVCGWFWSKVYLVNTMVLSIPLKKLPVKHFLLWAEPPNDVDVGTSRVWILYSLW